MVVLILALEKFWKMIILAQEKFWNINSYSKTVPAT
jgi:hypothetical protein